MLSVAVQLLNTQYANRRNCITPPVFMSNIFLRDAKDFRVINCDTVSKSQQSNDIYNITIQSFLATSVPYNQI